MAQAQTVDRNTVATAPIRPTSQAGAKVTIACKLPHGLELRLFDMVDVRQAQPGGRYETVKEARQRLLAGSVIINGNAVQHNSAPEHQIIKSRHSRAFTDGFALTPNVDKAFWDEWLVQNADHPAVKAGLILAYEKPDMAADAARERAGDKSLRSGLEPLLQQKDPRAPKRINKYSTKDPVDDEEEAA